MLLQLKVRGKAVVGGWRLRGWGSGGDGDEMGGRGPGAHAGGRGGRRVG